MVGVLRIFSEEKGRGGAGQAKGPPLLTQGRAFCICVMVRLMYTTAYRIL